MFGTSVMKLYILSVSELINGKRDKVLLYIFQLYMIQDFSTELFHKNLLVLIVNFAATKALTSERNSIGMQRWGLGLPLWRPWTTSSPISSQRKPRILQLDNLIMCCQQGNWANQIVYFYVQTLYSYTSYLQWIHPHYYDTPFYVQFIDF